MIKFIKNNMSKLVLLVAIIVCSFIFIVVVPSFNEIFDSLGVDLPQITKGILYLSKMWLVILLPISAIYFYIVIGKNIRIVKVLTSSLIVIFGLIILVIVIAMFMPMFYMGNIRGK
ncbi:MAG: hypothetical protein COS68_06920 [Elusimicrobia bacterium CG06_land_8_20_14_3_00_38_11]|nr:MAG: hypothetical protein COS68_06920 [Elusimicrobia bacterium CG06_land_8_20_14_3_00_38_11]